MHEVEARRLGWSAPRLINSSGMQIKSIVQSFEF